MAGSGECDLILVDLFWPGDDNTPWRTGLTITEVAKAANERTVVVLITSKEDEDRDFRTAAKARGADVTLTWKEGFGPGKVLSSREIAKVLAPTVASRVPTITRTDQSLMGLFGLDTVAYSEESDETQIEVVKSFLGHTSEVWNELASPLVSVVFVFTGDGLVLGIGGDTGPRLALNVALRVSDRLAKLAGS